MGLDACLFELSQLGFGKRLFAGFDEAQLQRGISVVGYRLHLHYGTGTRFHYRYGNHDPVFSKDLGHADFASDDCFIH